MKLDLAALTAHAGVLKLYENRLEQFHREGANYKALCPFKSENTPSFDVRLYEGKYIFKCFSCQEKGDIIDLVMQTDQLDKRSAINAVAEERDVGWEGVKRKTEKVFSPVCEAEPEKQTYDTFPVANCAAYERALVNSPEGQAWLLARGITLETALKLHFGYRTNINTTKENADIANQGWIVMPCIRGNTVVSVKYRSIVRKAFSRRANMETALFNTDTISPLEDLYVTEGEFDAAILEQAGLRAVSLPSASCKLTPEMKDLLMAAGTVILAGDTDGPGAESMERLWKDLGGETYLLKWEGVKDANEAFLKTANGDVSAFRELVEQRRVAAKSEPIPHIHSLQESMLMSDRTDMANAPQRLRFPWKPVDDMAILLPGSVMVIWATNTKMGKSTFVMNFTLAGARSAIEEQREVVLNYQCELSTGEFSNLVAAHILGKDRNTITHDDYARAAAKLGSSRYYVGYDPTATDANKVLDLIEAGIRRLGVTVAVLDTFHFICRGGENEVQNQALVFRRIKQMAVQYGVKFVVVGQPRKADKLSRGKQTHISDAKGSETFGSDSDAAFTLHRDWIKTKDADHPPTDDYNPITEVSLLAARARGNGPTFTTLLFKGAQASFHEISRREIEIGTFENSEGSFLQRAA